MARYNGPVCRLCRREGQKLFLKGQRCNGQRCAFEKKAYAPGQFGASGARRQRLSDYGTQMREKQKLRRTYGVAEKSFRKYINHAERMEGVAGENLLKLLERRFDNIVYRAGLASSRAAARQMIVHGHFMINDRKVNVPSYMLRVGDVVKVKPKSLNIVPVETAIAGAGGKSTLSWLERDIEGRKATFIAVPERAEIDTDVNEQMIIEFYSR